MLKGKEFGKAIGQAIQRKLDNGQVKSKAEIARHFSMKPPSLSDWVKKGAVSKDKLPELWRYFSDVAGPDHWGMTDEEWPRGLGSFSTAQPKKNPDAVNEPAGVYEFKTSTAKAINDIVEILHPARRNDVLKYASALLTVQEQEKHNSPSRAGQ